MGQIEHGSATESVMTLAELGAIRERLAELDATLHRLFAPPQSGDRSHEPGCPCGREAATGQPRPGWVRTNVYPKPEGVPPDPEESQQPARNKKQRKSEGVHRGEKETIPRAFAVELMSSLLRHTRRRKPDPE